MLARLATAALVGLTAYPVGVEVDIGRGLPAVTVVGLGGTAVLEARDRLRAAFGNTGYEWPDRRITVSLPPADLPKQGSGFDLSVAYALLDGFSTIEVEHLQAALAAWRYCEESALYLFGDASGDPVADQLLKALRDAYPGGLDATEQHHLFGRNISATRIAQARAALEERELIITEQENTGRPGRPRITSRVIGKGVPLRPVGT
jgi:hypothetical protein